MQKGAGILIKAIYIAYISLVMFVCLYNFSDTGINLGGYFLGIRADRWCHFIMFFPYPFIAWLVCNYSRHLVSWRKRSLLITVISGLLFAALTEIMQYLLTETRQCDIFDMAADFTAIILGTIIVAFMGHRIVRIAERLFGGA